MMYEGSVRLPTTLYTYLRDRHEAATRRDRLSCGNEGAFIEGLI